jgi:branched-chain amino acid transport system ATP-binding protein
MQPHTAAHRAPLLQVQGVTLEFKGVRALHEVGFEVRAGELFSIIGPNGAGKTSLLNCISGRYQPTRGSIDFAGQRISGRSPAVRAQLGIARTFQNLALFAHMSVIDNIKVGRHHLMKKGFLAGGLYWGTGARTEEAEHHAAVEDIIDFLEIQPIRNRQAGTLSYGLRKRVELARAVAARPQLLLLDEPMAGMNLEEKEDMARYIHDLSREWGTTIIMIEHDMGVVMDMSDRVMVLNFGEKIVDGAPAVVSAHPQVRAAYLGEDRP